MKYACCKIKIRSKVVREFFAEFLGTFVLITFGNASVAQSVLSLQNKGDFFSINWGWGLAVLLGVLVSGGVSGGHLNPAVSLAVATLGKFPWWKVPHYVAAQYLGAFLSSALVFLVYWDALVWYEHDIGEYRSLPETAGIFSTYPSPHLSFIWGVFDQFLGTALLLFCVCAITDKSNMKVSKQLVPLYIGFTVLGLGVCFGYNCGYAVNPARDLAPRLFTALAGWGPGVFTSFNHWWVVPVLACHAGGVAGAWLYYLVIELHWEEEENKPEGSKKKTKSVPGLYPSVRGLIKDDSMESLSSIDDVTRESIETIDDDKYKLLPVKYGSQEELRRRIKRSPPIFNTFRLSPASEQENTKNGSLLNLFDESEDYPSIPLPFAFGPLPPSPVSTPSPKMERIVEVTETLSSSSDSGSIPQTEVEVLEIKENLLSPRMDKQEGWKVQENPQQIHNKSCSKDKYEITPSVTNKEHFKHTKDIKHETKKEKRRKVKKEEIEKESMKNPKKSSKKRSDHKEYYEECQPTADADEVMSNASSACDCPAHVHDRESPLKISEVRFHEDTCFLFIDVK